MDHVNIISIKAITIMAPWATNIICIFGFSMITFIIGYLVYSSLGRNKKLSNEKLLKIILYTGSIGTCVLLILSCTLGLLFRVPSGRYKYKAAIDEENMTVAEYNKFMRAYNHSYYKDGVYHFKDWPDDYK